MKLLAFSRIDHLIHRELIRETKRFGVDLRSISVASIRFDRRFTRTIRTGRVTRRRTRQTTFIMRHTGRRRRSVVVETRKRTATTGVVNRSVQGGPTFVSLQHVRTTHRITRAVSGTGGHIFLSTGALLLGLSSTRPVG